MSNLYCTTLFLFRKAHFIPFQYTLHFLNILLSHQTLIDNHLTMCYNHFMVKKGVNAVQWTIPGSTLSGDLEEADQLNQVFGAMFLPGGMVLSQVAKISGLEPYTIQNWVKRGFLSPPQEKRYSQRQLCRILNINMLNGALTMDQICGLLSYINGALDDESDDLIDDAELYFMFVKLAVRSRDQHSMKECESTILSVLQNYREPVPGAKERIFKVLKVMISAWYATRMRQKTEQMLSELTIV